jgi:hypothetical protein
MKVFVLYVEAYLLMRGESCKFVKINQWRVPDFVEFFGLSSKKVFNFIHF